MNRPSQDTDANRNSLLRDLDLEGIEKLSLEEAMGELFMSNKIIVPDILATVDRESGIGITKVRMGSVVDCRGDNKEVIEMTLDGRICSVVGEVNSSQPVDADRTRVGIVIKA